MSVKQANFISYASLIFRSEKGFFSLAFFLLASLSLAWFLGQTAVIESQETSIILMGEVSRLFCTLGSAFPLSSYLHRLQQSGEVNLWLSGPLSRFQFILQSFVIGLSLSLFLILLSSLFMFFLLNDFSINWIVSHVFESAVLLTVTLFFTLNFSSLLKIQTLLFLVYFLGRFKGFFLASLSAPWLGYSDISTIIFKILLAPLPDFSLFYQTINSTPSLTYLTLDALISITLFLALTHMSFQKKNL